MTQRSVEPVALDFTIAHTETGTVQRARHDIVFEGALRERAAAMGAGVADGITGPVNVEEGDPLVSGVDQLGLPGLQLIGVRDFDIRRHEGPPWEVCGFDAAGLVNARRHAPAPPPVGVPETPGARIWCIATPLRIVAGLERPRVFLDT